jgi:hypothetical protein
MGGQKNMLATYLTPPPNFIDKSFLHNKFELLLFVTNRCTNNCEHCWSKDLVLSKEVDLIWYNQFFSMLNSFLISQIKLSGGEVSLYSHLRELVDIIRKYVHCDKKISIFSNGNNLISANFENIMQYLLHIVGNNKNICYQVSADEYHVHSYAKRNNITFEKACLQYTKFIKTFISAAKAIQLEHDIDFSVKIKVHCNINRSIFHREVIYADISDDDWNNFFIVTEGLIKSGNATSIKESKEIKISSMWSAFVMPGMSMTNNKMKNSILFNYNHKTFYLNLSKQEFSGTVILGWWNLINRYYVGGSVIEFLEYLKF